MSVDPDLVATMEQVAALQRGKPRRTCTVDGCDRKHSGCGFCGAHYARWVRTGDPEPDRPISSYKPDTYWATHDRLKRSRGLATTHTCADCGKPAREWCYDHTDPNARTNPRGWAYSLDLDRYRPLCRPCKRHNDAATKQPLDTEQITHLYRAGHSTRDIATALNQPYSRIRTALITAGITLRPSTHTIHRQKPHTQDQNHTQEQNQRQTQQQRQDRNQTQHLSKSTSTDPCIRTLGRSTTPAAVPLASTADSGDVSC